MGVDGDQRAEGRRFVPLPRLDRDHPLRSDPMALWMYHELIQRARYSGDGPQRVGKTTNVVECAIGQAVYGRGELAKHAETSVKAIRTAERRLIEWGLVTVERVKARAHLGHTPRPKRAHPRAHLGSRATVVGLREFWLKQEGAGHTPFHTLGTPPDQSGPLTDTGETGIQPKRDAAAEGAVTGQASDHALSASGSESKRKAVLAKKAWESAVVAMSNRIADAWDSDIGGARVTAKASRDFVLNGLLRSPDPLETGERILELLGDKANWPRKTKQGKHESLWAWFSRMTDGECWLGSEDDVRFQYGY